jgi:predicted RNA-binding protein with PIN domain
MSLHYVIDGYNLINHSAFLEFAEKSKDQRIALASLIVNKKLCGSPKNKISLVFDGYPPSPEANNNFMGIDLIFSRGSSADEKIKTIAEKSSGPKNKIVVSDDKEIRFCVRAAGAGVLSVEEFMRPVKGERRSLEDKEALKKELNYSQVQSINQELEKRWLKGL